jgi:hypothetical protein
MGVIFSGVTYFTPVVAPTVTAAAEGASLSGTTVVLGNDTLGANGGAVLTKNREIGTDGFNLLLQDFTQLPDTVNNRISASAVDLMDTSNDGAASYTAVHVTFANASTLEVADVAAGLISSIDPGGNRGFITPLAVGANNLGDSITVRKDRVAFDTTGGIGNFYLMFNAGFLEFATTATNTVLARINLNVGTGDAEFKSLTQRDAVLLHSLVALVDGAGASIGTLTNAPSAGDPTKWIRIDDNGTPRFVPSWQ